MTDRINPALEALKDIYFAYSESQAATKLNEATKGKMTPLDLQALRDYCIDGLNQFVEGMIEKYLDDLAQEVLFISQESKVAGQNMGPHAAVRGGTGESSSVGVNPTATSQLQYTSKAEAKQ